MSTYKIRVPLEYEDSGIENSENYKEYKDREKILIDEFHNALKQNIMRRSHKRAILEGEIAE